ncbi:unnamed protein product, partial [Mesorhabditis spiculigera]
MYGSAKSRVQLQKQDSSHKLPRMPLTDDQRQAIKVSYAKLAENPTKYGNELFIRLFADFPDYKDIWPRFRAIPDSSIVGSDQLRTHATVYMKGLGTIVSKIENEEELQDIIKKIAQAHIKFNISRSHVEHMAPCLLAVLKNANGSIDPGTKEAWEAFFEIFGDVLVQLTKGR